MAQAWRGIMTTNSELLARRQAAVPRGVASATNIFADAAVNARLTDVEGKTYIDFASGIGVVATGHRHPRVIAAVERQLQRFTHTAFQVNPYESYIELAERLNALAPFRGPAKTIFFTTGAEAVENAVKIARVATGRQAVVAFGHAFHGRTLLTSSLTGKVTPYKARAGAPAPEIYRLPFPAAHAGITLEHLQRAAEELFLGDVEPARVAALIIEPVQGEGGFNPAGPEVLQALRTLCDRHGILLIADEIQSGYGRTGKLFAIEHSGVEPDLVTVAKSLAGGFPLSGVIGRASIMDAVEPGGLGGTYAGSPLGCAAALAVLDIIRDEQLLERATVIGTRIRAAIEPLLQVAVGTPIANLRGLGAMIGFDVVQARGSTLPDGPGAKRVLSAALARGLVALTCGIHGETIRLLVPLTISDADLSAGLAILKDALTA
jgi:4-aminobutyrate aminotransferase / (S)-3-amino-2-methylpropionate transaminase / 5-aminovalerate transaminase